MKSLKKNSELNLHTFATVFFLSRSSNSSRINYKIVKFRILSSSLNLEKT